MKMGRKVEEKRQRGGLVTTAARAALRRARGVAPTGVGGANLQAHEHVKSPAKLLINRDGWETKPFTGGDETTAAAESKAAALEKLSSGSGVCVLQRRKEAKECVRELI
jgi:hypothetical protein